MIQHLTLPPTFDHESVDWRTLSGGSSVFFPLCVPNDARLQRVRKALRALRLATRWERTRGGVLIHVIRRLDAPPPSSPFDILDGGPRRRPPMERPHHED